MKAWDHPLIQKGMPVQLEKRRARIAAVKDRSAGKSASAHQRRWRNSVCRRRLSAFLMQRALLLSGLDGFAGGLGQAGGGSGNLRAHGNRPARRRHARDRARRDQGNSARLSSLADLDPPPAPDNIDTILEGNIYQRHVVLCGATRFGGSVSGLTSRVFRRGAEFNTTTDPEALTGKLVDIVAHVANTLPRSGRSSLPGTSSSPARSRRR